MADLHNDVTYKGWGKASMVYHRECMGICTHPDKHCYNL